MRSGKNLRENGHSCPFRTSGENGHSCPFHAPVIRENGHSCPFRAPGTDRNVRAPLTMTKEESRYA